MIVSKFLRGISRRIRVDSDSAVEMSIGGFVSLATCRIVAFDPRFGSFVSRAVVCVIETSCEVSLCASSHPAHAISVPQCTDGRVTDADGATFPDVKVPVNPAPVRALPARLIRIQSAWQRSFSARLRRRISFPKFPRQRCWHLTGLRL